MRNVEVILYTDESNGAVLKLPNRQMPGVLIQADTLSILISEMNETLDLLNTGKNGDAKECLEIIIDRLKAYYLRFQQVTDGRSGE